VRQSLKAVANTICIVVTVPLWAASVLYSVVVRSEGLFTFFAQIVAMLPGGLGVYLRRAYYRLTLGRCGRYLVVGFGSLFTSRRAEVGDRVWIGQYSLIGKANIGPRVLISDHVSVLSGGRQHMRDDDRILRVNENEQNGVVIGHDSWIGAHVVVMARIGPYCTIGAGAVVARPIEANVTAVGVPARKMHV